MCRTAVSPKQHLIILLGLLAVAEVFCNAGKGLNDLDFLEEAQARAQFGVGDFVRNLEDKVAGTPSGGIRLASVKQAAVLATLPGEGMSIASVTLKPCAINQPHSHPRGSEALYVTEGTLNVAFREEIAAYKTGGRVIGGNLTVGQGMVIPQGLVHWATNFDCKQTAQFIATFPTRDPGTTSTMHSLFGDEELSNALLRATTGLDDATIKKIRVALAANANPSVDAECMKACNIPPYEPPTTTDDAVYVAGR